MDISNLIKTVTLAMALLLVNGLASAQDPSSAPNQDAADLDPNCKRPEVVAETSGVVKRIIMVTTNKDGYPSVSYVVTVTTDEGKPKSFHLSCVSIQEGSSFIKGQKLGHQRKKSGPTLTPP